MIFELKPVAQTVPNWKEFIADLTGIGYKGYLSIEDLCGARTVPPGLAQENTLTEEPTTISTIAKLRKNLAYIQGIVDDLNENRQELGG